MSEYAVFIDNQFKKTEKHHAERPDDIPNKKVKWYPVGGTVEGDADGWTIINDNACRVAPAISPAPQNHVLKTTVWIRMTDDEVVQAQATLEGLKTTAPKLYRLFVDSTAINHTDPVFFPQLKKMFTELYGADRTEALLKVEG